MSLMLTVFLKRRKTFPYFAFKYKSKQTTDPSYIKTSNQERPETNSSQIDSKKASADSPGEDRDSLKVEVAINVE